MKARSLVRFLIHRCIICKRYEGAAYTGPPLPPLPTFRVKEEPPFTYVGVDFAGPLYTRTTGTQSDKVWICLFTCCVIRAINLEVVTDLSTEAFIRCLKRFTAKMPRKFISDNGKTFKAAAKFLKIVFRDSLVQDHLAGVGIDWLFNIVLPKLYMPYLFKDCFMSHEQSVECAIITTGGWTRVIHDITVLQLCSIYYAIENLWQTCVPVEAKLREDLVSYIYLVQEYLAA